ncbi:MAG TPA: hypothetical protein VNV44_05245 [Solirubrobacteraceae bacterium]|jgi:hypothetical protein|nr:hypothetical protein [Solirubrobacteraceae bacterium]
MADRVGTPGSRAVRRAVVLFGAWLTLAVLVVAPQAGAATTKITYKGQMVSFRPTGSAQELFGNYNIEVNWTESAELDLSEAVSALLGHRQAPQINWRLESLTGKVHHDQAGDPVPPDAEECTATLSPRPGFSQPVAYQVAENAGFVTLTLKTEAPFLTPSFMSSTEAPETSFCTANAIHVDGKQAYPPPEGSPQFAEYLAAYRPSLTERVQEQPVTKQFPYSYTFENPPLVHGRKSTVSVNSDITIDTSSPSGLSIEFPDGKPVVLGSPIELLAPPYSGRHHEPLSPPSKPKPTAAEEEAMPRELEPALGAIGGWKMRCSKALPHCKAGAVVTALLKRSGRKKTVAEVIGGGSLIVAGGHTDGFKIRLSRAGLALLRSHRRLVCTLKITATAPSLKAPVRRQWPLILNDPRG